MPLTKEDIDSRLAQVREGKLALGEFADWAERAFVERTPAAMDPGAEELLAQIYLYIAEHSSGHRTVPELQSLLVDLLPQRSFVEVSFGGGPSASSKTSTRGRSVARSISFQLS